MQARVMNAVLTSPEESTDSGMRMPLLAQFQVAKAEPRWKLGTRIGFRFVFAYVFLFFAPLPLEIIPQWQKLLAWVGKHIFQVSYPISFINNGSGDTTSSYVETFCFLVIALLATLVWSLLDPRRANYTKLNQWLRLYGRMMLGIILVGYGAAKVIPTQMPAPSLATLTETFGQSSPMHLLWTFIGASKGYSMFAGASEVLAAVLLFIPGCTTLAALIAIGVLSNVFMLNMCYDVPVKIYSFHLLLLAVLLAAPDFRRLAELFLFRRKVELHDSPPLFRRKWLNRGLVALQLTIGVLATGGMLYFSHHVSQQLSASVGAPLYGIWTVEDYTLDGKAGPPVTSTDDRWQRVFFGRTFQLVVESGNGTRERFGLELDKKKQTMALKKYSDEKWTANLTYQNPQPDTLTLIGQMDGYPVNLRLHRADVEKSYLLTSRGFHWINEVPFNQ